MKEINSSKDEIKQKDILRVRGRKYFEEMDIE